MVFLSYLGNEYKRFYNGELEKIEREYKGCKVELRNNRKIGLYKLNIEVLDRDMNKYYHKYIIPFLPKICNKKIFNDGIDNFIDTIKYGYVGNKFFKEFDIDADVNIVFSKEDSLRFREYALIDIMEIFICKAKVEKWDREKQITTINAPFERGYIEPINSFEIRDFLRFNIIEQQKKNGYKDLGFLEYWKTIGYTKGILKTLGVESEFSEEYQWFILDKWVKVLFSNEITLQELEEHTRVRFYETYDERLKEFQDWIGSFDDDVHIDARFKEEPDFDDLLKVIDESLEEYNAELL